MPVNQMERSSERNYAKCLETRQNFIKNLYKCSNRALNGNRPCCFYQHNCMKFQWSMKDHRVDTCTVPDDDSIAPGFLNFLLRFNSGHKTFHQLTPPDSVSGSGVTTCKRSRPRCFHTVQILRRLNVTPLATQNVTAIPVSIQTSDHGNKPV